MPNGIFSNFVVKYDYTELIIEHTVVNTPKNAKEIPPDNINGCENLLPINVLAINVPAISKIPHNPLHSLKILCLSCLALIFSLSILGVFIKVIIRRAVTIIIALQIGFHITFFIIHQNKIILQVVTQTVILHQ